MILHFSKNDSEFLGLFPRDKSIYFRHFHRHLQGTLSTFDIDICRQVPGSVSVDEGRRMSVYSRALPSD